MTLINLLEYTGAGSLVKGAIGLFPIKEPAESQIISPSE